MTDVVLPGLTVAEACTRRISELQVDVAKAEVHLLLSMARAASVYNGNGMLTVSANDYRMIASTMNDLMDEKAARANKRDDEDQRLFKGG